MIRHYHHQLTLLVIFLTDTCVSQRGTKMSGPSYPGGYPTDPSNQPGYPQYPQQPQQPYTQPPSQPPAYPPSQPPAYPPSQPPAYPPYGQPPAYPPYGQPPAYPPKQGGGAGRVWLIVGIIAAVLVVACVGLCVALGFGARFFAVAASTQVSHFATQAATEFASAGALNTATNFCAAVQSQDYTTAYSYLSPSLQQQYSQSQFTQDNQNHDNTLGSVTQCVAQGLPNVTASGATITVMVTRTLSSTPSGNATPTQTASASGQFTLVEDSSGSWTISSIDSSLNML
jgi:hypothetical protein